MNIIIRINVYVFINLYKKKFFSKLQDLTQSHLKST